ncbi:hypothetical protein INR49_022525 [Caranx melampygus]|nr:hypothetical protein INR49_022525 [Caranx melampygus]
MQENTQASAVEEFTLKRREQLYLLSVDGNKRPAPNFLSPFIHRPATDLSCVCVCVCVLCVCVLTQTAAGRFKKKKPTRLLLNTQLPHLHLLRVFLVQQQQNMRMEVENMDPF